MKLFLLITVPLACLMASAPSCSTTTPNAATNERNAGINAAGTAALHDAAKVLTAAGTQALLSVAQQELSGGHADYGNAAAAGVWSQVNSGTAAGTFADIVNAYSAGRASQTAREASAVASKAIAAGQSPQVVADAVATTISTAAGAPPAK